MAETDQHTRDDLDEIRDAIRQTGLRATSARIAVLRILRAAKAPVSHAEVADVLETTGIDRATVFRNLNDLTDHDLARRSELGDHVWRFEAVDPNHVDDGHPHFVCSVCGTVSCVESTELEKLTRRVANRVGKVVEILLRGVCRQCGT